MSSVGWEGKTCGEPADWTSVLRKGVFQRRGSKYSEELIQKERREVCWFLLFWLLLEIKSTSRQLCVCVNETECGWVFLPAAFHNKSIFWGFFRTGNGETWREGE